MRTIAAALSGGPFARFEMSGKDHHASLPCGEHVSRLGELRRRDLRPQAL
jgi:hypothetical protein